MVLSKQNRSRLKQKLIRYRRFQQKNAILIFSEPRGGSTWLMEVLMENPKVIVNWEPFHKNFGVVPRSFEWGWLATSNNINKSQLIQFLQDVISFRFANNWLVKYALFKRIFTASYVLTKFVRANRILQFVTKNLNLNHKPIYILRHPITTCISQLKTFNKMESYEMFIPWYETMQLADYDIKNKNLTYFLESLETPIEQKVAYWCLNNNDNICKIDSNDFYTVFYEDIVINPEIEFAKMFESIGLKVFDGFEKFNFRKASASDYQKNFRENPEEQLRKFQKYITTDVLNRVQAILDIFGITVYSAFHHLPIKK
ncbi:sulfotransferase [Zunongwangia atlantica]|uniref:Uncharacterized protein n=1 Tax=Zunongwangia atlantica 22II14-10F7 TaxID=1185767 RepID=A0A1Y1T8M6_9FLAO|nr:sulfotransferase [Zunongwangia atlantica]ORL47420.1 hypothetical protein IIF7_01625 [Zunongwangia atlantica 22II14-10F7]